MVFKESFMNKFFSGKTCHKPPWKLSGIITITIMLYQLKSSLIGQFLVIGLLNKLSQDR